MSDPYVPPVGGPGSPSTRSEAVIAALEAAVDALVPSVRWIARQVGRLALVALAIGLIDALLVSMVARDAGIVVGAVAIWCVVVFAWYWIRLRQFVSSAPALRAEIRNLTGPVDGRVALDAATRHLGDGTFLRRLQAAESISGTIGQNPLIARAGTVRRQLLPTNISLVGWSIGLTLMLVLSLPLVLLVALLAG